MNLIQRYKQLNIWNKIAFWGSFASIIAFVLSYIPKKNIPNVKTQGSYSPGIVLGNYNVKIENKTHITEQRNLENNIAQWALTRKQSNDLQLALMTIPIDSQINGTRKIVRIQYYLSNAEGMNFRDELSLLFKRAGWEPWAGMNDDSRYEHGLWIYGPMNQTKNIQRAFALTGIPLQLDNKEHNEEQDRYSSVIVIGRNK
jgi:hypothetical protein